MDLDDAVAVRDSKDPTGPALSVSSAAWLGFLRFTTSELSASD
jgi:hypothetical protein